MRNPLLAQSWTEIGEDLKGGEWSDELIARAVNRLEHGDVKITQYGVRVALREDLGDDRVSANAYWPEGRRHCLCFYHKQNGQCSHELAAMMIRGEV